MSRFAVTSPPYPDFEFNLTVALDPPEYHCEYAEVEADTVKQAKVKAVREFRRHHGNSGAVSYCEGEQSPFRGLAVLNIDALERSKE